MGIQNFGKLYDSTTSNITRLIAEKRNGDGRVRIGVDASILMIRHLKSSENARNRLHSKPRLPIDSLGQCCRDFVYPIIKAGGEVIMVFDGASSHIKGQTHAKRYGSNDTKQERLKVLYKKRIEGTTLVDAETLSEVRDLRKDLIRVDPDMIKSVVDIMRAAFDDKVHFIGAPFEADHQLGYLYLQGAIDYIFTIDADIMVFGTDVIKSLKADGKCALIKFDELVKEIPQKMRKGKASTHLTHTITKLDKMSLHHLGCFLGNDYIKRIRGNGPTKARKFIAALAEDDGSFLNDELKTYSCIDTAVKHTFTCDEEKRKCILQWYDACAMFTYGPVFIITPNDNISLRDAIVDDSHPFEVCIGQMCGTALGWEIETQVEDSVDNRIGRKLIVGWNPTEAFATQLERVPQEISNDLQASISDVYKECAILTRWSKRGVAIKSLPSPKFDGEDVYHGSILKFDDIPINCYSLEDIKFYLSSRQVNYSHCNESEVYSHADKIFRSVGESLRPIQKELMRGSGGYVSPEVLQPITEDAGQIKWNKGDDLLQILRELGLELSEAIFTDFFGKRNGTRKRILLHLEGGSYDIAQIKATTDLKCKGTEDDVIVIEGSCAPSQKLKDGNKENFYTNRLVLSTYANGKFKKILKTPFTNCNCPNGCIVCSHGGCLLFVVYVLANSSSQVSFQKLVEIFPEPINITLRAPILVEHVWSIIAKDADDDKRTDNIQRNVSQTNSNIFKDITTTDGQSIDDLVGDEYDELDELVSDNILMAAADVPDTSITPTLPIVGKVIDWMRSLESRATDGSGRQSVEKYNKYLDDHVARKNSSLYRATQLNVLDRIEKVLDKNSKSNVLMKHLLKAMKEKRDHTRDVLMQEDQDVFTKIDLKRCVKWERSTDIMNENDSEADANEINDREADDVPADSNLASLHSFNLPLSSDPGADTSIFDSILNAGDDLESDLDDEMKCD